MKIILAFLFGIIACALAAICTNPNAAREVFPHPTNCSRYVICAFGNEANFACPTHISNFDSCAKSCLATSGNCFTCVETTTLGTTTQAGDTTTVTTTTTTEEPTFVPTTTEGITTTLPADTTTTEAITTTTLPADTTTTEAITTTTLPADTTISVPTAPVVPPTPPVNV